MSLRIDSETVGAAIWVGLIVGGLSVWMLGCAGVQWWSWLCIL